MIEYCVKLSIDNRVGACCLYKTTLDYFWQWCIVNPESFQIREEVSRNRSDVEEPNQYINNRRLYVKIA